MVSLPNNRNNDYLMSLVKMRDAYKSHLIKLMDKQNNIFNPPPEHIPEYQVLIYRTRIGCQIESTRIFIGDLDFLISQVGSISGIIYTD